MHCCCVGSLQLSSDSASLHEIEGKSDLQKKDILAEEEQLQQQSDIDVSESSNQSGIIGFTK